MTRVDDQILLLCNSSNNRDSKIMHIKHRLLKNHSSEKIKCSNSNKNVLLQITLTNNSVRIDKSNLITFYNYFVHDAKWICFFFTTLALNSYLSINQRSFRNYHWCVYLLSRHSIRITILFYYHCTVILIVGKIVLPSSCYVIPHLFVVMVCYSNYCPTHNRTINNKI